MSLGVSGNFSYTLYLEGAQQFSSGQGHSMRKILIWNFAKGTTAKAQGTSAIAVVLWVNSRPAVHTICLQVDQLQVCNRILYLHSCSNSVYFVWCDKQPRIPNSFTGMHSNTTSSSSLLHICCTLSLSVVCNFIEFVERVHSYPNLQL